MKRLTDDEIIITNAEAESIASFIYNSLDRDWDRYTDTFICGDKWEDGMKRMNPEMYQMQLDLFAI